MGIDCRVVAKLKDGTIKFRVLDRLYVFEASDPDHADHVGLVGEFTIEGGLKWCVERTEVNKTMEPEESTGCYSDREYHNHWVSELKSFLRLIAHENVVSLKIIADCSRESDDLLFYENDHLLIEI